jgi:ZIP family zinc transporter
MPVSNENVGVAFALVIGAGGATAIGASVVFFPRLVKLASRRVLASSLALSAGVMTYVSFVEILQKSLASFIDAGHTEEQATLYSTLCFFGGVVVMLVSCCTPLFVSTLTDFALRAPKQENTISHCLWPAK